MTGWTTRKRPGHGRGHLLRWLAVCLGVWMTGTAALAPAQPARVGGAVGPSRSYAFIGVSMGHVTGGVADRYRLPEGRRWGVLVNYVIPDSPAHQAGLRSGDIIHSVEGRRLRLPADLLEAVAFQAVDVPLTLDVSRPKSGPEGHETMRVAVTTVERTDGVDVEEALERLRDPRNHPDAPARTPEPVGVDPLNIAGLSLGPASDDGSVPGLRVFAVAPNSEAAMIGFFQGDLVVAFNDARVASRQDVLDILEAADPNHPVRVTFERDGKTRLIRWALTLPLPTPTAPLAETTSHDRKDP